MAAGYGYDRQRHTAAWRYLLTQLQPDIALLQEVHADQIAAVAQQSEYRVEWGSHYPQGRWGSAVLTKGLPLQRADLRDYQWLARFGGAAMTCRVQVGQTSMLICSIHARAKAIEESELAGIDTDGLSVPGFTDVWPLYVIFNNLTTLVSASTESPEATRFIVGGDLNASRQFDRRYGLRGNHAFFDQARECGFIDLTALSFEEEPRTFFRTGNAPYQLDYLFSDHRTASQVDYLSVDQGVAAALELSDHAPVIATVNMSASTMATTLSGTDHPLGGDTVAVP